MSDDDMIRRGDALATVRLGDTVTALQARIAALPAVQPAPVAPDVAGLVAALVEAREEAHSIAHSEFDWVWSEADFATLTPLADAILAALEGKQ